MSTGMIMLLWFMVGVAGAYLFLDSMQDVLPMIPDNRVLMTVAVFISFLGPIIMYLALRMKWREAHDPEIHGILIRGLKDEFLWGHEGAAREAAEKIKELKKRRKDGLA